MPARTESVFSPHSPIRSAIRATQLTRRAMVDYRSAYKSLEFRLFTLIPWLGAVSVVTPVGTGSDSSARFAIESISLG